MMRSFSFKLISRALKILFKGVPIRADTRTAVPSFFITVIFLLTGITPFLKALPMEAAASALIKNTPKSSQLLPAGTTWPNTSFIIIRGDAAGYRGSIIFVDASAAEASCLRCLGTAKIMFSAPVAFFRISIPSFMLFISALTIY